MIGWTIQFLDDTQVVGFRELFDDQMILYQGMFGVPNYLIWEMTSWPQKTKNVKAEREFTFNMFSLDSAGDKEDEAPDYMEYFVVENITFDVSSQKFRLFAVSKDWHMLNEARGVGQYDIGNSVLPVSGIEIIKKLVNSVTKGKVKVVYLNSLKDIVKYIQISQDMELSVLDTISRVCQENGWEFCLNQSKLYIGEHLYVEGLYPLQFTPRAEHIKSIQNVFFQHITSDAQLAVPMMVHGDAGRIIWIKHHISESSMISFLVQKNTPFGFPTMFQDDFVTTLQGKARDFGDFRLNRNLKSNAVMVGKVFGTFAAPTTFKGYSAPEFGGDVKTFSKDLLKREFYENDYGTNQHLNYVKEPTMTTPYAGNNVGMLFPQDKSHRVLLTPDGERDVALVGPAYFGPKDGIPYKANAKDFRLQLPGGWVLYIDGITNEMVMQQSTSAFIKPTSTGTYIKFTTTGDIEMDATTSLKLGGILAVALSKATHSHKAGNLGIIIPPHDPSDATLKLKGA